MADHLTNHAADKLRSLYQDIGIDTEELSDSRAKLATRLAHLDPAQHAAKAELSSEDRPVSISTHSDVRHPSTLPRFDSSQLGLIFRAWLHSRFFWTSLTASSAALLLIFSLTQAATFESILEQESLVKIQQFVAVNGDHLQLFDQASNLESSAPRLGRLNALAVVSLLGQQDVHKLASAQGLVEDPRPEFRAYYLEFLLDYADEDFYNIDYIEALMEQETDPQCLYLLGRLLKLATSNQHSFS
ncbi:MAG: hypothetical protein COC19_03250 [SAR86 cluster bacterium]|uniref:Uncharacterized protein n=1 Tax=SAR86 cluster bacterium TaxID=2030880 RepID=A0A2A4MQE7_9GAMM|nr:MAG: hypothetical protein COC19_03250 [SAR86 cluster bacterium]